MRLRKQLKNSLLDLHRWTHRHVVMTRNDLGIIVLCSSRLRSRRVPASVTFVPAKSDGTLPEPDEIHEGWFIDKMTIEHFELLSGVLTAADAVAIVKMIGGIKRQM